MYLLLHIPTGQLRAGKVFRKEGAESKERELHTLRQLRHEALPQIFDILERAENSWLIMEYISGCSLRDADTACFDAENFFRIAEYLTDVLCYLHARTPPVLHLDIKPSNILLTPEGKVLLIDFGSAIRQIPEERKNPCMGTVGFAAPEQMAWEGEIDERTDIYGLGAVLQWYLKKADSLSAAKEKGTFAENIRKKVQKRIQRFYWIRGAEQLVEKCMNSKKELRYGSSMAVLRAIQRESRRVRRRQRTGRAFGACVLLGAVLLFTSRIWITERQQEIEKEGEAYEKLIEMAEGLGFEAAAECYEQAAVIRPYQFTWCTDLLARIEADFRLEQQEEEVLKRILFLIPPGDTVTVAELLEKSAEYGVVAYGLAMDYWYYYEGHGGKSAAVRWFERALEAWEKNMQEEVYEDKAEMAELHIKMGGYYEKIGQTDTEGNEQIPYSVYWKDLRKMWRMEAFISTHDTVKKQVAEELLAGLILHGKELQKAGEEKFALEELLEELEPFVQIQVGAALKKQWQEAERSVARLFSVQEKKIAQETENMDEMRRKDYEEESAGG